MRTAILAFAGGVVVSLFVLPIAVVGVLIYLLTDSALLTLGILFVVFPLLLFMLVVAMVVARCLRQGR